MANMYINAMTALWNSAGTTYSAIKMNVTNAASGAASKLLELQVGSADKFTVDKTGAVVAAGTITSAGMVTSSPSLPVSNDGAALGSALQSWSDLYLASGGVINWSASDVTITHAANNLVFTGAASGYIFDALITPAVNDGAALGTSVNSFSDLFLATGGVINWATSDVFIGHAANLLTFNGASTGYRFDASVTPTTNDIGALGSVTLSWSDLFLATGGVINFANDMTITHVADVLTVAGGDLRSTTAGATATSVVTVGGTQTLTGKTLTSPTINGTGTIAASTITATSNITSAGTVTSAQHFVSSSTIANLATTGTGTINLRPNGVASDIGKMTIDGVGNMTVQGTIDSVGAIETASGYYQSGAGDVVLANSGTGGAVILRPNGPAGSSTQTVINATTGDMIVSGAIQSSATFKSSSVNLILGTTGTTGGVYMRPRGPGEPLNQAYQANDGGFRSNFFHTTSDSTAANTHSFYTDNPKGTGSIGVFAFGNGTANSSAGYFYTYPTAGVGADSHCHLAFHQPAVAWWAIYAYGPSIGHSWQIHSDARIKSDFRNCDCADAHKKVRAIPIKSYRRINNHMMPVAGHTYDEMGFVAQDVETVIPEAVRDIPVPRKDEKGFPLESTEISKAVNPYTLLGTLWAAVQHQAGMIERLEAKIAALEGN